MSTTGPCLPCSYLDMIVTPGVVDTFKARSRAISTMRRMLEEDGALLWGGLQQGGCRQAW